MTPGRVARRIGLGLSALVIVLAAAASSLATHDPAAQFSDYVLAPPMVPHMWDDDGRWRAPFVYPVTLENRLARRYRADRSRPLPLTWFRGGRVATTGDGLWFPLGTDALGRDVFTRVLMGARLSLGVAAIAALGTLLLGALVGGIAGLCGGAVEALLMKSADFVIALPAIYLAMTLRAVLPLVLSTTEVFWCMVLVLAGVAWPVVARGVRAIVRGENQREYAEAARASGATRTRLLLRHLLPASAGFLAVQATLLVPAFIAAEATLSYVGLGFAPSTPSWGVMLKDASEAGVLVEAPWLLAPAAAIALAVLAINLVGGPSRERV